MIRTQAQFTEEQYAQLKELSRATHEPIARRSSATGSVDATAGETDVTGICRDPDDDNLLACAVATGADSIVSGDKDLLALEKRRGVKLVAPRTFELLFKD